MEFLHNTRKLDDGELIGQAIRMAEGKRLTYRTARKREAGRGRLPPDPPRFCLAARRRHIVN